MTKRRPRAPGVAYLAITLVLVVLVGVLALSSRQPPPPTIAEFAPQAVENITDAPSDQASSSGRAGGAGGEGGGAVTPTPAPGGQQPIVVPRVRKCVGDPPRQIEDPQSPPCVPYWAGDNGGATSQGVTRDEIVIVRPQDNNDSLNAIIAFVNKRFEFYGRRIVLKAAEPVDGNGPGDPDPAKQQATAEKVAALRPFASLNHPDRNQGEQVYYDALAARGIISVNDRPMWRSEAEYAKRAPFEWTYLPGGDDAGARSIGRWACRQLQGRPADFAGGDAKGRTRLFGLVTNSKKGFGPDTTILKRELDACGLGLAAEARLSDDEGQTSANAIARMKLAGVTSVLLFLTQGDFIGLSATAIAQNYYPEWLMSTYLYFDQDVAGYTMQSDQRRLQFGLSWRNKNLPIDQLPSTWAITEGDPSRRPNVGTGAYDAAYYIYPDVLLLASGIQMAGPRLTPASFEAGLQKTAFPNPGAGAAPYWQARVGFANDHSMVDDAAAIWWGEGEYSYYTGQNSGTFCYVDKGARFTAASMPRWQERDLKPFTGSCH